MKETPKPIKAWWFAPEDKVLGYGDGRRPRVGTTHIFDDAPECCVQGLHASEILADAICFAESGILYRVEISGDIDREIDKLCGTHRKYLARFDAKKVLDRFSRKCAFEVSNNWSAPKIVRRYLKTGNPELYHKANVIVKRIHYSGYLDKCPAFEVTKDILYYTTCSVMRAMFAIDDMLYVDDKYTRKILNARLTRMVNKEMRK